MPAASRPLVPWPFNEPVPSTMTGAQLMRVLQMRRANFQAHQAAGAFKHLEVSRPVGNARYSGHKVDLFRRGESTVRFGARRAS